jgi:pimeloyl-ACP methyl ester carboxylesterase
VIGLRLALCASAVVFWAGCAGVPPRAHGHLTEVRGAPLYVTTEGSGTPVLFLHGDLLFFDNNFAAQRGYFARSHQVVGIDQQAQGHSPDRDRPLSYREMAEDTAAVIRTLGLGPVDVVGHSGGGNIALVLAYRHPELVRRLVVSGANLGPSLPPDELERRRHASAQDVARTVHEIDARLPPSFRADYARVSPDGPDHWWVLMEKAYRMWLEPVLDPADLRTIVAPVLVMAGDHDFSSLEETAEIERALPHGQLLILPGTGHGTFIDRPELSNLAVCEFLDGPGRCAP